MDPQREDLSVLGPLAPHETRGIFDRYSIVRGKDLREAGERLSRCSTGADGESRTPKAVRPVDPKSTASASSATSALMASSSSYHPRTGRTVGH